MTTNKYRDESIHTNVMLVELRMSQWTARKMDKRVGQAVAAANNVDEHVGNYYKSLLDPEILKNIKRHINDVRARYYKLTLPWSDEGPRVLPADMYFEFMEEMQTYREKFEQLVNEFLSDYPFHREEAKRFLGDLFLDEDYPEPATLAGKFAFHLNVMPMPKANDFRCDIGAEEVEKVRQQIEQQTAATMQRTVRHTFERILEIAERYADRLSEPDNVFRNSMVESAAELADMIPKLNFTNDPELDRLGKVLRDKLAAHEPDTLRHNMGARKETAAAAKSVVSDIESIFGGK